MFENLAASLNPSAMQSFGLPKPINSAVADVLKRFTQQLGYELQGYLRVLDKDGRLGRKLHQEAGPLTNTTFITNAAQGYRKVG